MELYLFDLVRGGGGVNEKKKLEISHYPMKWWFTAGTSSEELSSV
jgi:hypothetical protein